MKTLIIAFCLVFIYNCGFGQGTTYNKTDSTFWERYNAKYNNPQYVIDENPMTDIESKQILNKIDPTAILKIAIAHAAPGSNKRNVVYLTTDLVKIAAYQKKLASFSQQYQGYLASHQNRDGLFLYFLNSDILSGDRKDIIEELYNIPAESIKTVGVKLDGSTIERVMVFIYTTK